MVCLDQVCLQQLRQEQPAWTRSACRAITVPSRIWTRDRPECDFPTCAVACVCSCSLENPQSKACGKNLGKTWVKLRFCAIFKQKHWKKRRIFILSWLWAQKNVCHSRTKCKFSIFLSILLGVFEAQVTVDRYLQWIHRARGQARGQAGFEPEIGRNVIFLPVPWLVSAAVV